MGEKGPVCLVGERVAMAAVLGGGGRCEDKVLVRCFDRWM